MTTCLQKNPEERFQTAHDIKLELQWVAGDKSAPAVATAPPVPPRSRERLGWTLAVAIAIVLGIAAGVFFFRPAQSGLSIRANLNPPANATLILVGDFAGPPVLSPDGTSIALVAAGSDGKNMIWVRPLNAPEAHMLANTDGATFPFWSPDSRSVGFFAGAKLKTIDLNGGSPLAVCDAPFGRGGTWAPGGTILFAPRGAIAYCAGQRQRRNSSPHHQGRPGADFASLAVFPPRREAFSVPVHRPPRSRNRCRVLRVGRRPRKKQADYIPIERHLRRWLSPVHAWRPVDGAAVRSQQGNLERRDTEPGQRSHGRCQHLAHGRFRHEQRAAGIQQWRDGRSTAGLDGPQRKTARDRGQEDCQSAIFQAVSSS